MDITEARAQVIAAGHRLKENGLIARTWGNISARVDDTHFVITPSGMDYERLTPDDIPLVEIATLAHEGNIKPSSEKGIHALVYKNRPDANFVIHTHQNDASMIAALSAGIMDIAPDMRPRFGDCVPLGGYGLPGTKRLRRGVEKALAETSGHAVLMAHHGALVWGADADYAFETAAELETLSLQAVYNQYQAVTGKEVPETEGEFADTIVQTFIKEWKPIDNYAFYCCDAHRLTEKPAFVVDFPDGAKEYSVYMEGKDEPPAVLLYREIFKKRADIRHISVTRKESVIAVSMLNEALLPQLDDAAQLLGESVRVVTYNNKVPRSSAKRCEKALRGRSGLLLLGVGALCCGSTDSDADAARMILEKSCRTRIASLLFHTKRVIPGIEAKLMRLVYLKKYSKQF
ncbi:MAG: class II aldolase/adducin family protein [Oscillospiraceae bacterium]|jgi:L-fuculose-phosphate aldolase|nr:class II aldolase/adducin family protein [Oscillospiraceae bacterium]